MERVAELLDPKNGAFSYRQALVRLWSLASDHQRLNHWEQLADEKSIAPQIEDLLNKMQEEESIGIEVVCAHPLSLIRALDDYLASTRLPSSQSSPVSQSVYQYEEDNKSHWLVPVTLAARRLATMNRQSARLARWFHHHAVLPCCTVHNIEVTCALARSDLHTCLETLANTEHGKLNVWVAHFDDGADVVWDTTSSPVGNWRTKSVEPHTVRQVSVVQTLTAAAKAGAQVVVFPEFTLDLQHRDQLVAHLRQHPSGIQLVVAGAFHSEDKVQAEDMATDLPAIFNTAPVYTGSGRQLFTHRKLRLFGKSGVGTESAGVGKRLHVLVTPIGCMTVLICKDFLDEDPRVDNLLAEVPVDWVWVPSYGDETTLKVHKERARKLATVTVGTSSAIAQTQNTAMKKDGETQTLLPGFGHVAGKKTPCDVPTTGGVVEFELGCQPIPPKRTRPELKRVK